MSRNRFRYSRTRWPVDPAQAWERAQMWLDFIEAMENIYQDAPNEERDAAFDALTADYDAATRVMTQLARD